MVDNEDKEEKESVLDRKVHLEDLVFDIPQVPRLCDQIDSLAKQRIDIGDCELYIEQEGEGTPLVLLHGGPGSTHHYFHPHFSRAKEFAKVIYYDQRGCGLSDREKGKGYSIDQLVNDLENLRKALNIDNWVVLGHSYGGLIAQCYAIEHPERLKGLILTCSGLTMSSKQYEFLSEEEKTRIKEIHESILLSPAQALYNAFLNGEWKRQHYYKPSRERVAQLVLYEWDHDPEFRDSMCKEITNIDLNGAFDYCPIPTMIMNGKLDLMWNILISALHENNPNVRLETFEYSSHLPFEEQPKEFFDVLCSFVQNLIEVPSSQISQYKDRLSKWKDEREELKSIKDMVHEIRNRNDATTYQKLTDSYSKDWLQKLHDHPVLLCYTGFALYVSKQYEDALTVFKRMEELSDRSDPFLYGSSLMFQAFMLDLLEKRDESIPLYKRVRDMNLGVFATISQFKGLKLSSGYAARRIEEPFQRIEVG